MKRIITALSAVSVLIIFGCATSTGVPENNLSGESVAVEKGTEEKSPVTEIIDVPYIVKETSFFSDGYVESYKVFTFNDDMSMAREDLFDSFDEIIESVVYDRISVTEVKRSLYNARGELQSWKKLISNTDGSLKKMESYSADNKLQTSSEYVYDGNGNKISWTVVDSDGIVLSVTKYIYESGLNTGIEIYDASMIMYEYFELEYNGEKLIRNSHFDKNGKLKASIEYLYSADSLIEEKHLRANGSTSITIRYENDDKGSPVKIESFDGNGKLKDWNEKEYEYVAEEITVWE